MHGDFRSQMSERPDGNKRTVCCRYRRTTVWSRPPSRGHSRLKRPRAARAVRSPRLRGTVCLIFGRLDLTSLLIRAVRVLARTESSLTVVCGQPKGKDGVLLEMETIAARLDRGDAETLDSWLRGHFSIVHIDLVGLSVCFVTDRFSIYPICYGIEGKRIAFADRANAVPVPNRQIDPQSIYDYVYFHVIPAPRTIFREVSRMEPATRLQVDARGARTTRWWRPVFAADADFHRRDAGEELRGLLRSAVKGSLRSGNVGAYLSGGTDSSTIAGMLGLVSGRPARTYSIGFGAKGYDEMAYARIAARHFGTQHHELYVGPEHVAQGIPIIAAGYDQPFGNSSALPAYFCAKMAHDDGVDLLLAGDGGDELFGGNVRYARQKVFEAYWTLPQPLRAQVIEPLLLGTSWPRRLPVDRQDGELRRAGACSDAGEDGNVQPVVSHWGTFGAQCGTARGGRHRNSRLACRRTPTKRSKRPLWSTVCSATIGDSLSRTTICRKCRSPQRWLALTWGFRYSTMRWSISRYVCPRSRRCGDCGCDTSSRTL